MSQNADILAYLSKGRTLTALQALKLFGTLRLAARVDNLQNQGHRIRKHMVEVGKGKRVAEYYLG